MIPEAPEPGAHFVALVTWRSDWWQVLDGMWRFAAVASAVPSAEMALTVFITPPLMPLMAGLLRQGCNPIMSMSRLLTYESWLSSQEGGS
jgi:hypothetical protein